MRALKVLHTLNDAGYEAYLVGGGVRDTLLNLVPKDFDVATSATPEEVRKLFTHCRLIGKRFRLAHVYFGRTNIEVATFRKPPDAPFGSTPEKSGRLMRDNSYGSLAEDLVRRDFTVNALYYDVKDEAIIDAVGGLAHLHQKKLVMIGDPSKRYEEDPVRMLRAVRLSAKLQFEIDPNTAEPIGRLSGLLSTIPSMRLYEEMFKLLLTANAYQAVRALDEYGLRSQLLPSPPEADFADRGSEKKDALLKAMLALAQTHQAQGFSVLAAFLWSGVFWENFKIKVIQLQLSGERLADQTLQLKAANSALRSGSLLSIPKRVAQDVSEIWLLQKRLQRTRSPVRARRVSENPIFRSAFRLLSLRSQTQEPELSKTVAFWTPFYLQSKADSVRASQKRFNRKDRAPTGL